MSKTKPTEDVFRAMALSCYRDWYNKDVKPHLTTEQKDAVMRRISDLTLEEPIWLARDINYIEKFPELKPYSHSGTISGMQLVAVMEAIFVELNPEMAEMFEIPHV